MKLGKTVYSVDERKKEISQGVCTGVFINDQGYVLNRVEAKGKTAIMVEACKVHLTALGAEAFLQTTISPVKKLKDLLDKSQDAANELREKIIGKPEYEDLIKQIDGGDND